MKLMDTHCHLYSDEFKSDVEAVIERAREQGVERFYLPAIDSETHNAMLALEAKHKDVCCAMMGLHPVSVKANYKDELAIVEEWLQKRSFVAVGEIGLDFYWDATFADQQLDAFSIQMQWALERKDVIVIHTRNAMQQTIAAVEPFAAKGLRGIFHCFSGNEEDAKRVVDMGFLLGIGGVVTYKNSGLATALDNIDLSHMVIETDAPYLSPVPFRGKRNESSYLQYIVAKLAEIKDLSVEEVAAITTANAEKIFGS